ncbi:MULTISPECIES: carboxypeptidase-like regulatory domain-containing protein [unclassified Tenacibaculum]|uniref:TonB-dependent receptor n=1 Tax=unclassified Tenacibaculum TaxID=2635139 RepID=UPI001F31BAE6|nr:MULTISPECIES: carboxypeptidase-like regulatory domain-containing protein [unclassified Tenacibaculum]MCF2873230.1 TonB-dependent receptor [Tenacibaculum sp. Cn5-1]MCF2933386.1 TonB-dependent receptor [Tenacibaculum sp. Cn5-34]MCG7510033.1 TonB-dependent receptor [Tenacibaculum sp. Cn5-46]
MRKLLLLLLFPSLVFAQKTVIVKGKITNKYNIPIEGVAISYLSKGTTTNADGTYQFTIPMRKTVAVTFSHVSYKSVVKKFTSRGRKVFNYSPTLNFKSQELEEVVIKNLKKEAQGITKIEAKKATTILGANAGVENILMTLPGVSNNNELSTQYNVRGGNFDENLVYVNGIEVYRPFLIRSGQQEGLSFINPHLVQNINFSAGGFQAKYGDRLSSVLDITYRKPKDFAAKLDLSLLGGSFSIEDTFLNNKLSAIVGLRYRDNSLFVNSKQVEVNFRPRFTDVQTFLSYKATDKLTLNLLSNFSLNDYNYKPLTRKTRFGTLANPLELIVFYQGQEIDQFKTLFGAFSAEYQANENLKITGTVSSFNTQEEEHFDIAASYNLGQVDSNIGSESFGEVQFSQGIGSQINHARNDLDALISNVQLRATLKDGKNEWRAGIKYQTENIKDRIREWEVIDSLGFSVRPPHHTGNNQPYQPFTGPIEPFRNIRAENEVDINRFSGFVQFSRKTNWGDHQVWMNIGVRGQTWKVKTATTSSSDNQFIFSPRAQFAIKPDWEKDMLFRISGGWYSQPPFYKELRGYDGQINPNVKAQKSIHLVAGNDYSFILWERPFKLTTELYYKDLSDVNAYSVDNVRIRYRADNVTDAYAYGLDIRLNGEFVPGNDSWVSFGYLKTEENINNRGYIARPTDQRLKFGALFQDYVPNLPDLKAHLNIVYNTGLPGGAPAYADVYQYQTRLDDYKRADVGISYVFADVNKQHKTGFLKNFKEFTAGLELFNVFDIRNSITNTWVRDAYSKAQYGIPNFMTGRVLNFRVGMQF